MNHIEKIRAEIKASFNPERLVKDSQKILISFTKNFRLETSIYLQDKAGLNWEITKLEIFDQKSNDRIFEFFSNYNRGFYSWIETNNTEYLICAEDLCGGQTVIDLTNRKMSGYSPNEDGFIWTDFHLSPDGKILATKGCYWACPDIVKLFDFTDPMTLPLREIKEIELPDDDKSISGWLDNESFEMKTKSGTRIIKIS